jgi:hypothetical protein
MTQIQKHTNATASYLFGLKNHSHSGFTGETLKTSKSENEKNFQNASQDNVKIIK